MFPLQRQDITVAYCVALTGINVQKSKCKKHFGTPIGEPEHKKTPYDTTAGKLLTKGFELENSVLV